MKAIAVAVGAMVIPDRATAQADETARPLPRRPSAAEDSPRLRVSVHGPSGAHFEGEVNVAVQPVEGDDWLRLSRTQPRVTYDSGIKAGTYRLRVEAHGYALLDYTIEVPASGLAVPVYLGLEGWPSFRMAQSIFPFAPRDELVGVAFEEQPPSGAKWESLVTRIEKNFGLVPYDGAADAARLSPADTRRPFPWAAGGTIAFFRAKSPGQKIFVDRDDAAQPRDLVQELWTLLGRGRVRVGMPIDVLPGQVKILDNQYLVRLSSKQPTPVVRAFARQHSATSESIEGLENTWLFEFDERNNYRNHLKTVDAILHRRSELGVTYVEPNLIFELQAHSSCRGVSDTHSCVAAPSLAPTNDPWGVCQTNLALQRVPEAWSLLGSFGSSDVCVATIESNGINELHPEVDRTLVTYVDLCEGCRPGENSHGMSVFGIISAKPGNGKGISGIAPGVRHLAVRLKRDWWSDPSWYSQMILWLSGVSAPSSFPDLVRPADIISASHGVHRMPPPDTVSGAFERVTLEGRKSSVSATPLGTILVYSAGNQGCDLAGTQALATGPNVIAIGCTLPPDDAGIEKLQANSNYGDALALCAQGEDAPSLLLDPDLPMDANGCCSPLAGGEGVRHFEHTSAACPMVAATAALMLSVNRNLTSQELGDALRQNAKIVDIPGGAWQGHRSYLYGWGRLDVFEAVNAVRPPAIAMRS